MSVNIFVMLSLSRFALQGVLLWSVAGVFLYCAYGVRHSKLRQGGSCAGGSGKGALMMGAGTKVLDDLEQPLLAGIRM